MKKPMIEAARRSRVERETDTRRFAIDKRALSMFLIVFCLAAILSPQAHADTFTINFTTASGSPAPTSGSFDYDATHGFSNFIVKWDGFTFDLTSSSNSPETFGVTCPVDPSTSLTGFEVMSHSLPPCLNGAYSWNAIYFNSSTQFGFGYIDNPTFDGAGFGDSLPEPFAAFTSATGDWTITDVTPVTSTPEPGSISLLLTVMAAVGLVVGKKRLRRGPQARSS